MRLTVGQLRQVIKEEVARVRASRNGGNRRRLRENAHTLYMSDEDMDPNDPDYDGGEMAIKEITKFLQTEYGLELTPKVEGTELIFNSEVEKVVWLLAAEIIGNPVFNQSDTTMGDSSTGGMLGKMPTP